MVSRFPWPRVVGEEGHPIWDPRFEGDYEPEQIFRSDAFSARPLTEQWDEYDTLMYNEWLRVTVHPTLTLDADFLRQAKIYDGVLQILSRTGVGRLGIESQELYPDLVRQFMATLRIVEGERGSLRTTYICFKLHGVLYRLTLDELADLYGMDTSSGLRSIPAFADAGDFFGHIAEGVYSGTVRHVAIRHPVLRYVTKLLANTLFCAVETNALRARELFFLYLGLEDVYPGQHRAEVEIPHMGSIFAQHLLSLQSTPFGGGKLTSRVGSLLTPIFRHFGVDQLAFTHRPEPSLLGEKYLRTGHHLAGQSGSSLIWRFTLESVARTVQLPREELTSVDTRTLIAFRPRIDAEGTLWPEVDQDTPDWTDSDEEMGEPVMAPERDSPSPDYADPRATGEWTVRQHRHNTSSIRNFFRSWVCYRGRGRGRH